MKGVACFPAKERQIFFDFIRGVAIIMVVAIHTFGLCYTSETLSLLGLLFRQVMNCAVPIFCTCSAYFLAKKDTSGKRYKNFLIRQVARVYVPYLFCSLPYLFFDVWSNGWTWTALVKYVSCSYSVFYFVALIIQFYILLPLFKSNRFLKNAILGFAISFVWITCYVYIVQVRFAVPLILYAGVICCFWVYFPLGISCGATEGCKDRRTLLYICLSIFFLALSIVESLFLLSASGTLSGVGIKPTALMFSTSICLYIFGTDVRNKLANSTFARVIAWLGRYSFGVYLTHMLLLALLTKGLSYISFVKNIGGGVRWFLITLMVLLLNALCLLIAKRLFPRLSHWLLGV